MKTTPLAGAASVIAQATQEFTEAICTANDQDLCSAPEGFELKPEPPEGGCGTGAFIMEADYGDRSIHDLDKLRAVLQPLMLKWGVAYINAVTYDTDCSWVSMEAQDRGERPASAQPGPSGDAPGGDR